VAAAMQMLRSVIMPITLPPSSTTGSVPQLPSHICIAAAAKSVSGVQLNVLGHHFTYFHAPRFFI